MERYLCSICAMQRIIPFSNWWAAAIQLQMGWPSRKGDLFTDLILIVQPLPPALSSSACSSFLLASHRALHQILGVFDYFFEWLRGKCTNCSSPGWNWTYLMRVHLYIYTSIYLSIYLSIWWDDHSFRPCPCLDWPGHGMSSPWPRPVEPWTLPGRRWKCCHCWIWPKTLELPGWKGLGKFPEVPSWAEKWREKCCEMLPAKCKNSRM